MRSAAGAFGGAGIGVGSWGRIELQRYGQRGERAQKAPRHGREPAK